MVSLEGGAVSYERGTPVGEKSARASGGKGLESDVWCFFFVVDIVF